jgi:hypothetical protein
VAELSEWLQLMTGEIARRLEQEERAREERARRTARTAVVESSRDAQQQQSGGDRHKWLKGARPA